MEGAVLYFQKDVYTTVRMKGYRRDLDARSNFSESQQNRERIRRWSKLVELGDTAAETIFRAATVRELADYAKVDIAGLQPDQVVAEYDRIERSILAAHGSLSDFSDKLLVGDLKQGVSTTNEIARIADPGVLFSSMLRAQSPRTRFEARRALWMGAFFWKFEREIGKTEDLQSALRGLEFFLDSRLHSTVAPATVKMYHGIHVDERGVPHVPHVRLPRVDGSPEERVNGENEVTIAVRTLRHPKDPHRTITVAIDARPKSRLSAILKTMRKGEAFQDLRDILGVTITVFQDQGDELQAIVDVLDETFIANPDDRDVHPLRQHPDFFARETNANRDAAFAPEKFTTTWELTRALEERARVYELMKKVYPNERALRLFDQAVELLGRRKIPLEVQVMTMEDMVKAKLAAAGVNHEVYETKRVMSDMSDYDLSTLEILFPKEIYTTDWKNPAIQAAIKEKKLATMGLTRKMLDMLV